MPDFAALGLRRIEPIELKNGPPCLDPGAPPQFILLRPDQLVINEDYQRMLAGGSLSLIRTAAQHFDWNKFKVLNVAETEFPDIYEVVDGQHTAIAAVTNGKIKLLPCIIQRGTTLKEKAEGFLGINQNRKLLTKMDLYNAQVAAQDSAAIAVEVAMSQAGATLRAVPPARKDKWNIGDTMAIGTLMDIARGHGTERLTTLLKIAMEAKAAPISAMLLRALDLCTELDPLPSMQSRISQFLIRQGVNRLEVVSQAETELGGRAYKTMADAIADGADLPRRRMGKPEPKRRTKWMR